MSAPIQDVFMLFGDSITQAGWEPGLTAFGERLSHVYARKLDVLNRGYSGYNTEWALPVFRQTIGEKTMRNLPKVRVLVIWFGANDACIKPSPQHVSLIRFIRNLKEMVSMIKSPTSSRYSPTTRIILITPPPVNTYQRGAELASRDPPVALDREFEVTKRYAGAVREVGRSEDVAVVDIWKSLWSAAGEEERELSRYLYDGLHLNAAGYKILYDELIATITEKYPEVHYDNVRPAIPLWKDIDWDDPNKSFL